MKIHWGLLVIGYFPRGELQKALSVNNTFVYSFCIGLYVCKSGPFMLTVTHIYHKTREIVKLTFHEESSVTIPNYCWVFVYKLSGCGVFSWFLCRLWVVTISLMMQSLLSASFIWSVNLLFFHGNPASLSNCCLFSFHLACSDSFRIPQHFPSTTNWNLPMFTLNELNLTHPTIFMIS